MALEAENSQLNHLSSLASSVRKCDPSLRLKNSRPRRPKDANAEASQDFILTSTTVSHHYKTQGHPFHVKTHRSQGAEVAIQDENQVNSDMLSSYLHEQKFGFYILNVQTNCLQLPNSNSNDTCSYPKSVLRCDSMLYSDS